jgi:hypothetical protein
VRTRRHRDPRVGRRLVWSDVTARFCHMLMALAAITCAVGIAACGSVSVSGQASTNAASGIQFAQCMRANGVPSFPDGPITPASGVNPNSPAFESAQAACKKYLPRYAPPPPTPPSVVRQELALARCMRANGVPNFPDPNAQGNIQFPITSPIPKSPAFRRASNGPCKKYGSG